MGAKKKRRRHWPDAQDMLQTEIALESVALVLLDVAAGQTEPDEEGEFDALCEWSINSFGNVTCEGKVVSEDPRVALLVRCAHLLRTGELLKGGCDGR